MAMKQHRRTTDLPEPAWHAFKAGDSRAWNRWRESNPTRRLDLRGLEGRPRWLRHFDLSGADLRGADLEDSEFGHADLRRAKLDDARLDKARLAGADLSGALLGTASFSMAELRHAKLVEATAKVGCSFFKAKLERADLSRAKLEYASFDRADLTEANCAGARLLHASFERADLSEALFDGAVLRHASFRRAVLYRTSLRGADVRSVIADEVFVRGLQLDDGTQQKGVVGTMRLWFTAEEDVGSTFSRVDDLRAASLLSLLGERGAIASLIDAGSATVVLILGRFSLRRKAVLDRLADVLRTKGKIPIIFDFPGPEDRELSDTVRVIAALSEFIVVDVTDPRSAPLELQATVPGLMIPVVPIVQEGKNVFAMLQDLQRRYFWVLPPVAYADKDDLAAHVEGAILRRVRKVSRQIQRRREEMAANPSPVGEFGPAEPFDGAIDWIG